jgi:hypothetical protein
VGTSIGSFSSFEKKKTRRNLLAHSISFGVSRRPLAREGQLAPFFSSSRAERTDPRVFERFETEEEREVR